MSSSSSFPGGAHILIFPYPAQGHMIPLLDLSYHLSARGLSVTILVTPKNLPILRPLLSERPSIQTLVLPFPKYPSIPADVENVKDLPFHAFSAMMRALGELYDPLLQWFRSHPSPPTAIISDVFLGWTHRLASHLGVPRVMFWPSGATSLAVVNHLWRTMPRLADPSDESSVVSFPEIPSFPKYPWWQLSNVYRSYREGDPEAEFVKDGMQANLGSWGVVCNSFSELEGPVLEYLKRDLGHTRVWAVGPLLPPKEVGSKERGGSSSVPVEELIGWLDRHADGSVAYLCFGSQTMLTRQQMEALANGLESSGAHFLWCVKEPTSGHVAWGQSADEYGVVPTDFEDRTAGRGLVIRGWAPQVAILGHRAIGAFLTHCGTNSMIEGLVSGVPILAWPMGADHFVNATLLVDQLGMAVRVCDGALTLPDPAHLSWAIAELVSGARPEKKRALELSRAALGAVQEGGSSFQTIDELVKELSALDTKRSTVGTTSVGPT